MKSYLRHPNRDEVLEYDVPDAAVFMALGADCPGCRQGSMRTVAFVDPVDGFYRCTLRRPETAIHPGTLHVSLPRIWWTVHIHRQEPAPAWVYETGSVKPTIVQPCVIPGGVYDRAVRDEVTP